MFCVFLLYCKTYIYHMEQNTKYYKTKIQLVNSYNISQVKYKYRIKKTKFILEVKNVCYIATVLVSLLSTITLIFRVIV